ncbi:hypothetical protein GCM10007160_08750 [Litchfieldella qijiaojingensis]|uniref:Uncharacterized protein n=1 Tax=Litchfieldella qijiaojingensis TaxID=980347 RepID=A0ABQ2YI19_9GAMM|nr:hypothetical protein GCM10007160_08750 [Halomonas qijiaojingensis]
MITYDGHEASNPLLSAYECSHVLWRASDGRKGVAREKLHPAGEFTRIPGLEPNSLGSYQAPGASSIYVKSN